MIWNERSRRFRLGRKWYLSLYQTYIRRYHMIHTFCSCCLERPCELCMHAILLPRRASTSQDMPTAPSAEGLIEQHCRHGSHRIRLLLAVAAAAAATCTAKQQTNLASNTIWRTTIKNKVPTKAQRCLHASGLGSTRTYTSETPTIKKLQITAKLPVT